MKFTRTLALIVATTLIFAACSRESDEAVVAVKENTNPLLVYVPADTAYVFADLEPVPEEITDAYVARFQPVLDVMSTQVEQFKLDYATGAFQDSEKARFAIAVLEELGGNLSAENLEKFGISLQAHHAIYGMGVFPVIRFELSDALELRNAIGRIEAKMGFELSVKELKGTSYWRVAEDDSHVGLYIAILDQQLALAVFPVSAEDSLLAAFLGHELPATSMASSNALAIMNSKKGYSGYGSGILDLQKLSDEIFREDSPTRTYLGPEMTTHLASLDAVCVAEIKSIIDKAPRMTAGVTRFSANEMAIRYELEIESSLATGLASLVSDTPAATEGDFLLSASLAIKVGKIRSFVLEKANSIIAAPYQCEKLQQLNDNAGELVTQLNIPMPPMINNLEGLRVRMDDFDPGAGINQANGLLALHVDKPEMFVGMATMMVPGFESLDVANQSEPVKIPEDIIPIQSPEVFVLMSDDALGAAIGEKNAGNLKGFMAVKGQNYGTFFSVSHDMAKQLEIQAALSDNFGINLDHDQSPAHEYSEAVRKSYTAMLGRSRVDMRLTGDGLVIDSEMTFK